MGAETPDERYYIVEEAICDSLFLLMKEKEPDKITVTDIIKKAGIVRSTFYNHYENVSDLLTAVEDRTIQDIFSLMETFHPKNNRDICKSYFMTICDYTTKNPFLSGILRSPRGDTFFEKAMTMFHQYVSNVTKDITPAARSLDEYSYMIAGTIGCTLGVLHKWSVENFETSPEIVADILTQIFMAGMLPFM